MSAPRLALRLLAAVALLAVLPTPALAAGDGTSKPRLPPATKRALDKVFDQFVQTAVRRHDVMKAWDLVTPGLKAATTRAEWAKGSLPVYPYPAAGLHQQWHPSFVKGNDVLFDVLLHATNRRKVGDIAFGVEMKKVDGKWLVDSFIPKAMFSPLGKDPKIFAEPDLAPAAVAGESGEARLGTGWIVGIVVAFAAAFLLPAALLLRRSLRTRRELRRYGLSSRRTGLPPLPTSALARAGDSATTSMSSASGPPLAASTSSTSASMSSSRSSQVPRDSSSEASRSEP
jgi:hypothetical protein